MRIKSLTNRLNNLEAVYLPPVTEPMVIILNGVDSKGVTVSTREIVINPAPATPVRLDRRRRC